MRLINPDQAIEIWKEKDMIKLVSQEETAKALLDLVPSVHFDRPTLIINDQVLFLNQGYIDAMLEYEKEQSKKEAIEHLFSSLDSFKGEE